MKSAYTVIEPTIHVWRVAMATVICLMCNQQHLRLLHLLTHLIYPNFQLPDLTFKGAITPIMSELMWEKGNLSKHPSLPRGCRSRSHPSVSKTNLGTPTLILTSAPNHLFLFVIIFLFGVDLKHVYDQFQENNRTWTTGN